MFNNKLVTKFINSLMKDGKKTTAQSVFYGAFNIISEKGQNPLETFEKAIQAVGPKIEVKARRVGGASYQVPVEVRGDRKEALAVRWIIEAARNRSNKEYHTFDKKLAAEFLDASEGKGAAIKKKEDTLRVAEANRAFSHFKWQ